MFLIKALSMVSTALLMVWMYYFVLGGGPLLILKHKVPNDSRMIRGFFDVHYRVAMGIATVGAISFAFVDRLPLAAAMACVLMFAFTARRMVVPRMDMLRATISPADAASIRAFRRVHVTGFIMNVVVLAALTWTVSRPSLSLFTCIDVPPGCQGAECRHQCSL